MTERKKSKANQSEPRKPRTPTIIVRELKKDTVIVLGVPVNGVVPLLDGDTGEPIGEGILQTGISYSRGDNRPPKMLNLRDESMSRLEADPDRSLLDFDHIFAVDTNTDPVTKRSVTVTAGVTNLSLGPPTRTCTIGFLPAQVWCSPIAFPERTGWRHAITMMSSPEFQGRVAVFVDAHLRELPAINARTEPVVGDFFLPPNYELLYAGSDRGTTEYVGNMAMGECDRVANRVMKLTAGRSEPIGWFSLVVTDELVDG